ncbi:MAG: hypothetical protein N2423_09600, partial [Novosphingobium sp.]|nr:hypothetical protein [Novosphingobium sp.]
AQTAREALLLEAAVWQIWSETEDDDAGFLFRRGVEALSADRPDDALAPVGSQKIGAVDNGLDRIGHDWAWRGDRVRRKRFNQGAGQAARYCHPDRG